jgi:hypothetical protein
MSQTTVTSSVTSLPAASTGPTAASGNGNTSGTGSGTILLPHPSPNLSAQAVGQHIRAVVVGPTADGKVIVDSRFGKFALTLPTNPSPGSVLELQIVKSGTPVELLLLGSENRTSVTQAGQPATLIRIPQPPPALLTLTNGELFRGLVTGAAPDGRTIVDTRFGQLSLQLANAPAIGSALQLQIVKSGIPLEIRLVSTEAANTGQAAAAKGATSATLTVGETVAGRYAPSAGGTGAAPNGLTAGSFHARIVAIHPALPATAATTANEAVVTGRVVASQTGGPTIIETAAGRIALPATGGNLTGRFVTLQIVAEPGTVLPTNPSTAHQRSLMSLSQNWTALADVIDAVTSQNPQIAAQFTATAIPNTGVTLTAGVALFLAILTRGQMPEWLGPDVVRLMESTNRQPLLNRLSDDFTQIVRMAGEPTHSEWRVAMLPLMHDGSLQQIRLYLRERFGSGDERDEKLGTRFVIEASLSHLGDIQLDGLVRSARFDLMVRTQEPLPFAMRSEIGALFEQANEEFGVQGRINFQVQERFPVDPTDELSEHAVGVYA